MFVDKMLFKVCWFRVNFCVFVLVINWFDEKEVWVVFDGDIIILDDGVFGLVEKFVLCYWDLDDEEKCVMFDVWKIVFDVFCFLLMIFEKICSGVWVWE